MIRRRYQLCRFFCKKKNKLIKSTQNVNKSSEVNNIWICVQTEENVCIFKICTDWIPKNSLCAEVQSIVYLTENMFPFDGEIMTILAAYEAQIRRVIGLAVAFCTEHLFCVNSMGLGIHHNEIHSHKAHIFLCINNTFSLRALYSKLMPHSCSLFFCQSFLPLFQSPSPLRTWKYKRNR